MCTSPRRLTQTIALGLSLVAGPSAGNGVFAGSVIGPKDRVIVGKELFQREWVHNDPRSRGGDGLGPVFNDASCIACHHLGGAGGAGPRDKDVEILTPIVFVAEGKKGPTPRELAEMVLEQTGIRTSGSVILHKFGTDLEYAAWRNSPKTNGSGATGFSMQVSRRNTPALFGSGLIDAIPDIVIEAQESEGFSKFPEIKGRVCRLKGNRVGKFGWKAQTATLEDFVLTACSVELGLEVPGHSQSLNPVRPHEKAPGLDLTADECRALTAYVESLPAPVRRPPFSEARGESVAAGAAVFETIGCAACHRPSLGEVDGIYSDLLLHDMGTSLSDVATYYGTPVSPGDDPLPQPLARGPTKELVLLANRQEWRTPPLWGVRDSAPYLHDGRARTLDDAILRHGGEAKLSARRYQQLAATARMQLGTFLMSLSAPPTVNHKRTANPSGKSLARSGS